MFPKREQCLWQRIIVIGSRFHSLHVAPEWRGVPLGTPIIVTKVGVSDIVVEMSAEQLSFVKHTRHEHLVFAVDSENDDVTWMPNGWSCCATDAEA